MIKIGKSPPGMTEREIEMYRKIMQEKYPDIKDGTLDIEIDREPDGTECVDLFACDVCCTVHAQQHYHIE